MEEARRPDRGRARARRVVPAGTAGRRAVGRRARDGRATARARHREAHRRPRADRVADSTAIVGSLAPWLIDLAHGRDDRAGRAEPRRRSRRARKRPTPPTSIDLAEIRHEIDEMARDVAGWLARKSITARTVTIKVRYADFTTITRSHSTRGVDRRRRQHRDARDQVAGQDRRRPPAGSPARRQRPQLRSRSRRRRRRLRSASAVHRLNAGHRLNAD